MTVRSRSNGRSASSTSGLLRPAAQSSTGRAACSCLPWPAVLPRRPQRPLLLPRPGHPSTHPHPCYSAAMAASHRSRTGKPSYSSPRGLPLSRRPRLRVVPFLGLAIVHRRGALDAAWSMWSTTDFHRKSIVRGEADNWVHNSRKEVPPYYAKNNYSSTLQQGPTGRATLFREKTFPP